MIACPSIVVAQPSSFYVGGTLDVVTQTTSDTNPMGGTTWGGRALVGVLVSPHVALEFEPSFNGGSYSWQYSYRPGPSFTANVVVSRRNGFFSGQARIRYGVVEPVMGLSYINGRTSRHATIGTSPYFDDSGSDNGLAAVVGIDAAVPLTAHVSFVPTLRVFTTFWGGTGPQTSVGALAVRYGAGMRTTF
jgi:hypothetical protein